MNPDTEVERADTDEAPDCVYCAGFLFDGVVLHESRCPANITAVNSGTARQSDNE